VSVERAPRDAGLAQRLARDLLEPSESIVLEDEDPELCSKFAGWIAHAYALSGKPVVLVLDQIDDALRKETERDDALARIGPLLAATGNRLPGVQGFACKWVLCYRHEFHGEVRAWLEDVLSQARRQGLPGLASLPYDLSDIQRSHDWSLPVMGKPPPGEKWEEQSKQAFLQAIEQPLLLMDKGRPHYGYLMRREAAERLAEIFAQARKTQSDAPLVPELQVTLNHLLQQANEACASDESKELVPVDVPPDDYLNAEIKNALANHLQRALDSAFPVGRDLGGASLGRTRALLALRQLADAHGRRSSGLPEGELIRMLGPNGREAADRLSSPQARLIVLMQGMYSLSHDRLAEVVADLVTNEASRGNLLLNQDLIDLQWTVGQKLALYQGAKTDESALTLTRQQRSLIEGSPNTILFDDARRVWWRASETHRQRLARKQRGLAAVSAGGLLGLIVLVLTILMPPHVGFSLQTAQTGQVKWTVHEGTAVVVFPNNSIVIWTLSKTWTRLINKAGIAQRYLSALTQVVSHVLLKMEVFIFLL
jgi:hypothetical protein